MSYKRGDILRHPQKGILVITQYNDRTNEGKAWFCSMEDARTLMARGLYIGWEFHYPPRAGAYVDSNISFSTYVTNIRNVKEHNMYKVGNIYYDKRIKETVRVENILPSQLLLSYIETSIDVATLTYVQKKRYVLYDYVGQDINTLVSHAEVA